MPADGYGSIFARSMRPGRAARKGVRVALDDMSASRLDGAVIQYDSDEDGYLLDHPDAVSVAWCG